MAVDPEFYVYRFGWPRPGRTDGAERGRTEGQTERWTEGRTERRTEGRTDGGTGGRQVGQKGGRQYNNFRQFSMKESRQDNDFHRC